jgi:hypothetical protein
MEVTAEPFFGHAAMFPMSALASEEPSDSRPQEDRNNKKQKDILGVSRGPSCRVRLQSKASVGKTNDTTSKRGLFPFFLPAS